jgi:hypothetical protein
MHNRRRIASNNLIWPGWLCRLRHWRFSVITALTPVQVRGREKEN